MRMQKARNSQGYQFSEEESENWKIRYHIYDKFIKLLNIKLCVCGIVMRIGKLNNETK